MGNKECYKYILEDKIKYFLGINLNRMICYMVILKKIFLVIYINNIHLEKHRTYYQCDKILKYNLIHLLFSILSIAFKKA